ncbi:MAG: VCBS repeat-containing protein, partial [Sinomicrobium sp.]|nr:VCBS repeat-containing protein [Sinomicrobium sp.]
ETKRLKSIVTSVDGQKVLSYNFRYQYCLTTGRSQLTQIKQCDASEKCLSPATFTWQQGDPALIDSTGTSLTMVTKYSDGLFPVDVNADGLIDLVSLTSRSSQDFRIHTYKSDGDQLKSSASQRFIQSNRNGHLMPLDASGDGKTDLIYALNLTGSGSPFSIQLFKSNGDGFENPSLFESPRNITRSTGKLVPADINGDGKTDLVYYTLNSDNRLTLHTFISDGKTFTYGKTQKDILEGQRSATLIPMDVNGDGMMDLTYSNRRTATLQTYILLSSGDSFSLSAPRELKPLRINTEGKLLAADVNADGMQDLVYVVGLRNRPLEISTFFSNGVNFEPGVYKEGAVAHNGQFMAADINGDDKTDLMVIATDNSYPFQMNVYVSDGTNFQAAKRIQTAAPRNGIPIPMDMDGDAKTDIVYAVSNYEEHRFTKFISGKPHPDLISSFGNGIGGAIDVTYKPLTDPTVHTRGDEREDDSQLPAGCLIGGISGATFGIGDRSNGITGAPPPIINVSFPTYVVAGFTKKDGRGNAYQYNHKYKG